MSNIIEIYRMSRPTGNELNDFHKRLCPEISHAITNILERPHMEVIEYNLAHIIVQCATAFDHSIEASEFTQGKDYDFGNNLSYNVLRKILPPIISLHGKLAKEMALVLMAYVPAYKLVATDEAKMYTKDLIRICYDILASMHLDYTEVIEKYLTETLVTKK